MERKYSGFCAPTIILIVLTILSSVLLGVRFKKYEERKRNIHIGSILGNVVVGVILYLLCRNGHNTAAWILLFLPVILLLFFVINAVILIYYFGEDVKDDAIENA